MKRCVSCFVCYLLVTTCIFADSYTNTLPSGLSLIANQLDNGGNTFTELFPNSDGSRDGDVIQLYQCTNYVTYYFASGSPTGFLGPDDVTPVPAGVLAPGQGAFYYNNQSGSESVIFTGTPHVAVLPVALPCGFGQTNLLSRPTKGTGTYENITGYLPQTGATVQTWNGLSYATSVYTGSAWSPNEPMLNVGQAAFFIVPPGSVPVPNYTINVLSGYNLIANQLDHGSNTLGEIMPAAPDGSVVYKYDNTTATWASASYSASNGAWTSPNLILNPGEGAFLQSPVDFAVTFTGVPHVPVLPATIPSGETYLVSRQTNDVGNFENMVGTYPPEETVIYRWDADAQQYVTNEFVFGEWTAGPFEPTFAVGEAVWISALGQPPSPIALPPIITAQPTNLTVHLGDPATFAVTVANAQLIAPNVSAAYQWFFNSSPIPGATNSSFTISSVQSNNLGAYNVMIGNAYGATNSTIAYLTNSHLEITVFTPGITNCCWTFNLDQLGGSPGDITHIRATLLNAAGGVISSAAVITSPTSFQETTLSATSVIFSTTNSAGLASDPQEVTICFSNIPPTGAQLNFVTTPQINVFSIPIIDYGGCGSVVQVTNGPPLTPGCCAAKSWNLQGPFPGQAYTFTDTNYQCGAAANGETIWPSARYGAAMTYDQQTDGFVVTTSNLLVFGGADSNGTPTNDTWLWNGHWISVGCTPTIPARCLHAMVYDPAVGNTVLFGGLDANGLLGDTWYWDLSYGEWQQANIGFAPSPRLGHAMAYDPVTGMVVLFGGLDQTGLRDDTWLWNGGSWTTLGKLPSPSPRQGHAMAWDPNFGGIVLFGGTDSNGVEADMWKLTNNAGVYSWAQISQSGSPPRTGHAMVYDPNCAQIEVFGGFDNNGNPLGDTWEYSDAFETWTQALNLGTRPAPRGAMAATYYPELSSLVFFGGNTTNTSTTNFSNSSSFAPTNDLSEFYYNPNPVNDGINSNYTPCATFVTGPLWDRTLYTYGFSWASPGGWFGRHGWHTFYYTNYLVNDQGNTTTNGSYPGYRQDPASTSVGFFGKNHVCNDLYASPLFDCEAYPSSNSWCAWVPIQWPIYEDLALNGDFCPGVDINMLWLDSTGILRRGPIPVGHITGDSHIAPYAGTVFPDPCGPHSAYNEYLQYADPPDIVPAGTFLPGAWRLNTDESGPSKVNLRWVISQVGVGIATAVNNAELSPCATESIGNGHPCDLAYFEFDQRFGTDLRLKVRVQASSLQDVPTLQREGSLRQFTFYIDADNNTNTGDQCCEDLGADYYVQVTQSVYVDNNGDGQITNSATIYKWNPCAANTNACGVVGMWSQEPSGPSEIEYLLIGDTEVITSVPMSAVGNPIGAYSVWASCTTSEDTNSYTGACGLSFLPGYGCNCRMVLTRMADTNCPYVVSADTSHVTAGSSAPIVVTFNKPMSVINPSDITITPPLALSTLLFAPGNNTLNIRPASGNWPAGCYTITINSTVNDLSTNYLCSPYTCNLCVPDQKFDVVNNNGIPTTNFNQGDNIYVNGCAFPKNSAVTLYLVAVANVFNSGSLLADWTTTGPKHVTTDGSGCLPLNTFIGMPTIPGVYKVVADVNNDGIYETNLDRVTDLCGPGLVYGDPCTNLVSSSVSVWWPFSETSAAGPVNEMIEADNGVVVGTNTTLIPGELGQARTFNIGLPLGPGPTYVAVSNSLDFSGALSFANGDFSIELWVKTTETNEAPIVDKRQFAGHPPGEFAGYYFYLSNGVPTLQLSDGNSTWVFTSSAPSAATGNWTHVAVTVEQNLFAVTNYVNGVGYPATPSLTYNAPIVTDNTADLWMAVSQATPGPAAYFIGAMDELTMYKDSLAPAQVEYIYAQGANGKCAPPSPVTNGITRATNYIGNYTTFTIPAFVLTGPVTYQWYTNTIPVHDNYPFIFGGQTTTLTMLSSSVAQSGPVSFSVSDIFGIFYSSNTTFTVLPITPSSAVVGFNSAWKYWATGSSPGASWNQIGFNDSSWSAGLGLFGSAPTNVWPYPIQTSIEPPGLGGPVTVYYRNAFVWDGATNEVNLVTTNFIQDGAVFYLNGAEVGRLRVPANQTASTLASPQPNPGHAETILLPPGSLLHGTNLLAVEVHQSSVTANQDVFGLGLSANVSLGVLPTLNISRSPTNVTLTWSGPGTLQGTPSVAGPWTNLPAISPYNAPTTNGIQFYRLHVP